jgi:hypothetical protein
VGLLQRKQENKQSEKEQSRKNRKIPTRRPSRMDTEDRIWRNDLIKQYIKPRTEQELKELKCASWVHPDWRIQK